MLVIVSVPNHPIWVISSLPLRIGNLVQVFDGVKRSLCSALPSLSSNFGDTLNFLHCVEHFSIQRAALRTLRLSDRSRKFSAVKLYVWLCSRYGSTAELSASKLKQATGLDEDTIQAAREELVRSELISAERQHGQGTTYCYTVLNLKTRKPFSAREDSGLDGYFQCPKLFLHRDVYRKQTGANVLAYVTALAECNRLNCSKLRCSKAKFAKICGITQRTLNKALRPLAKENLLFLAVSDGRIEVLDPQTGESFTKAPGDDEPRFFDSTAGRRVTLKNLLTPENFKKYYSGELADLSPETSQQDVRCVFHDDEHPSMSINLDEGTWCCHSCSPDGGGMLAFEMKRLDTEDRHEAWKSIAKKLGVKLMSPRCGEVTDTFDYVSTDGEILYAVWRYKDGSARFFTPTINGKWKPGLNGARRTLYNLPDVMWANVVIITEGEKKAEVVKSLGLLDQNGRPVAVTCTGDAASWKAEFVEHLRGKRVVLFPDSDAPGQRYAQAVTACLSRAEIEYRVVDFSKFGNDVRDFLKDNQTAEDLVDYADCEWLRAPVSEVVEV